MSIRWEPLTLSQHLTNFCVHGFSVNGDIIYLICNVTSHNQHIKESWEFMSEVFTVCHHPDKSCNHMQCDSGNIVFRIFT